MRTLPLTALVVMLALAGCNQRSETNDTALTNAENATEVANGDAGDGNAADAVVVPPVPTAAADVPPADSQTLAEAAEIEKKINAGEGIEEVRFEQGWAWVLNGHIVRTSDEHGRNVAYFREGSTTPFLVQVQGQTYAYAGETAHVYDATGHAATPDAAAGQQAADAARAAGEQYRQAGEAVAEHAP
ncbi:MAG: hypothetical protein J7500_08885 [Sphingomonas sp.]|uniref:hypothetical protein n=1 Tax=Sphingomonas sp. TaxID=28214 RepID=UPI001B15D722|nr:hypothetical protein [Sphingomonas sp.]MBO9622815.1 hypothetical protein [Sphingomonas sp.]